MEERRGGKRWAELKTGCNTSSICRHMENTHIQTRTQMLGALCEDMLMQSPSQTSRRTGPHRSLLCPDSHDETHKAQPNERPETKLTCFYSYYNTAVLRVSPPFPRQFSPISRGFPGSENNNASVFLCCKEFILFLSVLNSFFYYFFFFECVFL